MIAFNRKQVSPIEQKCALRLLISLFKISEGQITDQWIDLLKLSTLSLIRIEIKSKEMLVDRKQRPGYKLENSHLKFQKHIHYQALEGLITKSK